MKRGALVATAVLVLLMCGSASAFMETFQYHPDDDIAQYWDNASDAYGSEQWTWYHEHTGTGDGSVSIVQKNYDYTNVAKIYARAYSPVSGTHTATTYIENAEDLSTDYVAFNIIEATYTCSCCGGDKGVRVYADIYDRNHNNMLSIMLWEATSDQNGATATPGLYEIQLLAGQAYLIINGTSQGSKGVCSESIAYIRLRAYAWQGYQERDATLNLYIDDISTSHAVGVGADRTPLSSYTHYMTHTELDPNDQPEYEIDASYTLKTQPAASYTAAKYEMKVRRLTDGVITNTTTLKEAGVAASDDPAGFGTLVYNRTDIFGENFTTYQFYVTKDGEMQAQDIVNWFYYSLTGSSWVNIADTLSSDTETDIDYSIDSPDYVSYNYYIKVISENAVLKETFSITSDTGTEILDTSGYDAGIYYVILQAADQSTSAVYDLAFDMTTISDIVIISGTTYNAQNNSVLTTVNINDSQLSTGYNTTSDGTGNYELQGFTSGVVIDINATKTNYTHQDFTFTPLQVGMYTMDLYLFPSNITRASTAIEGMVVSYPLHQGISNATVNIWNDTWSSNTTATSWGYYIFDNLTCDTSNVLNETFNSSEYDTWLSLNQSNIKNGSELVSNTTDETPFVKDTDYSINCTDGTIKVLSTGSMVNYTDYHIDYDYYIETTYHINATKSLYTNSEDYNVTATHNNWTVQNVLLHPIYALTVKVKDYDSSAFISSFTATVGSESVETTNGTAIFYLDYGLYTISVTSSGYYPGTDSLLLNQNKTSTTTLTKTESVYYAPHYVKFKLVSVFGEVYPNVATVVYIGATATGDEHASGTTGTDGSVTFRMTENTQYTLTFTNTTQSISETLTVYPKDTEYFIYIDSFSWSPPENQTIRDTADWWWTHERINVTYGWINFTYTDATNETASIIYWINDSNDTNIYSFNTTYPDSWTVSQVVLANNTTYIVHFSADHPRFDSLSGSMRSTISFSGKRVSFGWSEQWMYDTVAVCAIIFLGLLFSATSVNVGAVISALSGWMFMWMGWLSGTTVNYGMMVLATIIAVGFAMRKGEVLHT